MLPMKEAVSIWILWKDKLAGGQTIILYVFSFEDQNGHDDLPSSRDKYQQGANNLVLRTQLLRPPLILSFKMRRLLFTKDSVSLIVVDAVACL